MSTWDRHAALEALRGRNRYLFESTVRDGRRHFSEELSLIFQDNPPRYDGGRVAQNSLEYAVALAETGGDIETVRRIVRATLKAQDRRPGSFTCGNWFWMHNWETVWDPNAVSFMVPNYYYLLTHHGGPLGDDLVGQVLDALKLAGDALLAHRCQWAYSNIFTTNILCKLMIAHLLDDPRMRDLGYYDFMEWLSYTARFGITEFNSPTYTAVQIRALEQMTEVPAEQGFHEQVHRILRLYYTDLFLHYHPRSGQFAGTKSRHKPQSGGLQSVHTLLYRQTGQPVPEDSSYNANYAQNEYLVPPDVLELARNKPLPLSIEMLAPHNHMERRTWMTPTYALGSSSGGDYGASDVQLEALFGEGDRSGAAYLWGNPHNFELFSAQQRNLVVGAVRWRFLPAQERAEVGKPVRLTHVRVGYGPYYVPPDCRSVEFYMVLAPRRCKPVVYVGGEPWDGQPQRAACREPIVVDLGDVYIGYRSVGARLAWLEWADDSVRIRVVYRAPGREPWLVIHPLLLVVESAAAGPLEAFAAKLSGARLSAIRRGDARRVRGDYDGRRLGVDVPLSPPYLMRAGKYMLPEGRLQVSVLPEKPLPMWSRY